jgi:hypothetical protein
MNRNIICLSIFSLFAACNSAEVAVSTGVESGALISRHKGEQLLVTISEVSVHVVSNDEGDVCDESGQDAACDDSFIPVFEGEQVLDLFTDGELSTFLDTAKIPAGKITQVRLLLSNANWIQENISLPVQCSSCDETGLKLVPSGKLEVQEGEVLALDLVFDSELSLRFSETEARLNPVVHLRSEITEQ